MNDHELEWLQTMLWFGDRFRMARIRPIISLAVAYSCESNEIPSLGMSESQPCEPIE
jgi:hypothetical protein